MRLNTLSPARGSKKTSKRLGRGIGSGKGKTCAKGHKGQKARAGGYHKVGFEGGQMPLQRRLPKVGFRSRRVKSTQDIALRDLKQLEAKIVSLPTLREANLISSAIKRVKIFLKGEVKEAYQIKGIRVTEGAKKAILAAGGSVE